MSKISFKTKAVSTLLSLLLILQLVPLSLFAATMPTYSGALTLFDSNLSGDGYEYDASTKTLTITEDGLSISSLSGCGICTDVDHLTIILNGDLYIDSNDAGIESYALTITGDGSLYLNSSTDEGIYVNGSLTITIDGSLDINSSTDYGIYVEGGDIGIDVYNFTINSHYTGIYVDGILSSDITVNGDLNITSLDSDGICTEKDLNLTVYGETIINASDDAISGYSNGDITFYDDVTFNSAYGIYSFEILNLYVYGDILFNTANSGLYYSYYTNVYFYGDATFSYEGGSVDYEAIGSEYDLYIYTEGTIDIHTVYEAICIDDGDYPITIDGTGTVNIYESDWDICTYGDVYIKGSVTVNAPYSYSYSGTGAFEIADTATFNGVYYDGTTNAGYISGYYEPTSPYGFAFNDELFFLEGSTLYISSYLDIDLSGYTIDFTNANIINYGNLALPFGTDIASLNIAGVGGVEVDGVFYDNAGNLAYADGNFVLTDEAQVTDFYTWEQNADGVWVFTALTSYFVCNVYIDVDDAIFALDKDVKFSDAIVLGFSDIGTASESAANLTITGDYELVVSHGIVYNYMGSSVTVGAGSTLMASSLSIDGYPLYDVGSALIVNGNAILYSITLNSVTVNDGGDLLVYHEFILYDTNSSNASLTLGDNTVLLNPENGVLVAGDIEDVTVWTFTINNEDVAFDFSNLVSNIHIGYVEPDVEVDTDADVDADTESDLADTGVDTNIAFVIALMLTSLAVLVKIKKTAK